MLPEIVTLSFTSTGKVLPILSPHSKTATTTEKLPMARQTEKRSNEGGIRDETKRTIFRDGDSPELKQLGPDRYQCPFCHKVGEYHKLVAHLQGHQKSRVRYGGYSVFKCLLDCLTTSHYHCGFCTKIMVHITFQLGRSLPEPVCCQTCCKQYHCPFCSTKLFQPTSLRKLRIHLDHHFTRAVSHEGYTIHRCGLGCREPLHFHCFKCRNTVLRRADFEKHLKFCNHRASTTCTPASPASTPGSPGKRQRSPSPSPPAHSPPPPTPAINDHHPEVVVGVSDDEDHLDPLEVEEDEEEEYSSSEQLQSIEDTIAAKRKRTTVMDQVSALVSATVSQLREMDAAMQAQEDARLQRLMDHEREMQERLMSQLAAMHERVSRENHDRQLQLVDKILSRFPSQP